MISKIADTLLFYDLLNHPLTAVELTRYLFRGSAREQFEGGIKLRSIINEATKKTVLVGGFYVLSGQNHKIRQRIKREKIAAQKWKRLKIICLFLQMIPFVRGVGVTGSLTLYNTRLQSDFDLLIISQRGRIWTARALVSIFLTLINQKRYGSITKNKVCLNCFLTDASLEIGDKIKPHNYYSAQEYARLVPLFEFNDGLWQEFRGKNDWIGNYLATYPWPSPDAHKLIVPNWLGYLGRAGEYICNLGGNYVELLLKKLQVNRIKKNLTNNPDDQIFFSDEYLLFHPHSKSLKHLATFQKIISDKLE